MFTFGYLQNLNFNVDYLHERAAACHMTIILIDSWTIYYDLRWTVGITIWVR